MKTSKRGGHQKPITPKKRAEAERLIRTGMSNLEISRAVKISDGSVRNIRKRSGADTHVADVAQAVPAPAPEPAPAPPTAAPPKRTSDAQADTLARAKDLFEKSMAIAEQAQQDGNHQAAQRATRDAGQHAILIARLEKAKAENQDAVVIPREEIGRAMQGVRDRVRTLADVHLLCPGCGREMRIKQVKERGTR
jgi:hypothetical protein